MTNTVLSKDYPERVYQNCKFHEHPTWYRLDKMII